MTVGYAVYTNVSKEYNIELEVPPQNKEFETDVYEGLSRLMMGQNMLNLRMLSLHHFVKPHDDEFYPNCPECQLEKQKIIQEIEQQDDGGGRILLPVGVGN
jgi:hypothetical protein